jgi:TPR repeat protein
MNRAAATSQSANRKNSMKKTLAIFSLLLALGVIAQDKPAKPVNPAIIKAQREFEAKKAEAAKGDPVALCELGDLHYLGKGTGRNYGEAFKAYIQAAAKGNVFAEASLGWMHERGLGVKRDYKKAMEWYAKAAERGHAEAQAGLAEIYYSSKGLPKRDYVNAYKWYAIAAALGHKEAAVFAPKVKVLLREPLVTAEQKTKVEAEIKAWLDNYKKNSS